MRVLLVSVAPALFACAQIAGVDGDYREAEITAGTAGSTGGSAGQAGSAGTGGTAATGGSSGNTGCALAGKQCVGAVPPGWSGPVALNESGNAPPACSGDYPNDVTPATPLRGSLDVGETKCSCGCFPQDLVSCSIPSMVVYSDAACTTSPSNQTPLQPNTCTFAIAPYKYVAVGSTNVVAPPCTPTSQHEIPAPIWQVTVRMCDGGAISGSCDSDDLCLPPVPNGWQLCIHRAGDLACPPSYPTKEVFHESFADDRACSACNCGDPQGECAGYVALYTGAYCTGAATNAGFGSCVGPLYADAAKFVVTPPAMATCPPSASTLSGAVKGEAPTTFCCVP